MKQITLEQIVQIGDVFKESGILKEVEDLKIDITITKHSFTKLSEELYIKQNGKFDEFFEEYDVIDLKMGDVLFEIKKETM